MYRIYGDTVTDDVQQSTGWQLDQSAPEAYERYLVPSILTQWVERLLDRANVQDGDTVLDVACGTGIVARKAVSRVGDAGTVVGLDINEGMLAVAEQATADAQATIEWRQGDATALPFSDGRFDAVCCQQALQFFEKPATALEEMRRVLAPDGRVVLSVWRPLEYQPGYVVLADALENHVGEEAGTMMRSPFPAWDEVDLRSFARDLGFTDVSITIAVDSGRYPSVEEFVRREVASSPLAELLGSLPQERRDELLRDVEHSLKEYTDEDGVVFPMESYVLTAH